MKLLKKLAASMMCLLLAVCIFAGCATQTPNEPNNNENENVSPIVTSPYEYPAEESFTTSLSESAKLEFLGTLLEQAGENGALEALIRNANIHFTIDLDSLGGLVDELMEAYLPQEEEPDQGNLNAEPIDDSSQSEELNVGAIIDEMLGGLIQNYLGEEETQAIVGVIKENVELTGSVTIDLRLELTEEDKLNVILSLDIQATASVTTALINGEVFEEQSEEPSEEAEEAEKDMLVLPVKLRVDLYALTDGIYLSLNGSVSQAEIKLSPVMIELPAEEAEDENEGNIQGTAYIELIDSDEYKRSPYERIVGGVLEMVDSLQEKLNMVLGMVEELGRMNISDFIGGNEPTGVEDLGSIASILLSDIKVVTSGNYTFYKISPSVHEKVPTNIYLVLDKDGKLVELSAGLDIFNHIFIALTFNGELDEVKAPANAVKIHFKELTMLLDMVGVI